MTAINITENVQTAQTVVAALPFVVQLLLVGLTLWLFLRIAGFVRSPRIFGRTLRGLQWLLGALYVAARRKKYIRARNFFNKEWTVGIPSSVWFQTVEWEKVLKPADEVENTMFWRSYEVLEFITEEEALGELL